ncbi:MAG: hypothetical protein RIF41_25220 [Polyangiaceae bacterium]
MRTHLSAIASVGLGIAAIVGACGGTAIVDPPDDDGSGGSTGTSSTTSSGGSTSVSSGCDCVSDADCPGNFDCQLPRCTDCECALDDAPDGTTCSAGVCADGQCVTCLNDEDCGPGAVCVEGSCVGDLFVVCDEACQLIDLCLGPGPGPSCFDECVMDLSDCTDAEIAQVAQCSTVLAQNCDGDAWIGCMQGIGCLGF